jgi:hypothetical protein
MQSQISKNEAAKCGLKEKDQAFYDTDIGPAEIQALEIIEILDQKNLETQPTTAGSGLNEHRSLPDTHVLGLPMKNFLHARSFRDGHSWTLGKVCQRWRGITFFYPVALELIRNQFNGSHNLKKTSMYTDSSLFGMHFHPGQHPLALVSSSWQ